MPNEHTVSRALTPLFKAAGFLTWKISDPYKGGVPDFQLKHRTIKSPTVWVEMKYRPSWPKRPNTIVIPDLTPQQRLWLDDYSAAGDYCLAVIACVNMVVPFVAPAEWTQGLPTAEVLARAIPRKDLPEYIVTRLQEALTNGGHDRQQQIRAPDCPRINLAGANA